MHKHKFTAALVITTYNSAKVLKVTLRSVLNQSRRPDELIIADDGSTDDTKELVEAFRQMFHGTVRHVWQPNEGYRRSTILNKAIAASTSDYIITIDNDVILHRHFVRDHCEHAKQGHFAAGRRAYIKEKAAGEIKDGRRHNIPSFSSEHIWKGNYALRVPWLAPLLKGRHSTSCRRLMGSNMAFWKSDFVAVNGFEEAFRGWGFEDRELCHRFYAAGIKRISLCNTAIQWHLDHPVRSNHERLALNEALFIKHRDDGISYAEKGIDQYIAKTE